MKTLFYAGIFLFGFTCGVLAFGLFAMAMADPVTQGIKKPTSYQSACYRNMT
ncbi:hypothetical protein ACIPLR_12385 [Herbaspirillum huttiense]|uniref:hypothetical protein n=1 Tax=Herbaspirillum huttiense TaxID=863372 RepID=UPI00382F8A4C